MSDDVNRPEMNEQQDPKHSPVEHDFAEEQGDEVDERTWFNRVGAGIGVILAVAFVLFAVAIVIGILLDVL